MIALWMLYSTLIAGVLGAAAVLVERTIGPVVRNRRWIWVATIVASIALPVTMMVSPPSPAGGRGEAVVRPQQRSAEAATESSIIAGRIADVLARADARALGRIDRAFAIGWGIAAALAFAAYGVATLSLARRRRTWRSATVEGEPVLLARSVGPAVVGAVRPEIVVPEWSLELAHEQRALMIEHERQHVRARDPLVLHAAAMIVMVAPWNVALWWLNRRLRLAVELDCDARVLAAGRDVRAYGTLLLDVCSRRRGPSAAFAPALLERTSSLTRRILAMHPRPVRYVKSKAALGAAASLAVVVLACDMPTPEMLAPAGAIASTIRVAGKAETTVSLTGVENIRRAVANFFPAVARGEGEDAVLFVVRSSTGEILLTETQAASAMPRSRAPRSDTVAGGRRTARNAGSTLPGRVGVIAPDEISGIEVSKHAAGVVAPKVVSLIVITMKPGAVIPTRPTGQ